jgi:acyl-CoA thioesterase
MNIAGESDDAPAGTGNPFLDFLGIREAVLETSAHDQAGSTPCYQVEFREEHMGNPLIRTFHGGILASIGEAVAAMHLARERGDSAMPECATMTFDYLRPAFAKTLEAVPHTVRAGRRITTVSVQLRQEGQLVCIGRFLFPAPVGAI